MNELEIPLPENIIFEWDALQTLPDYLASLPYRYAIITDNQVLSLHAEKFMQALVAKGLEASLFTFPAGEWNKTRETKESIENQMLEKQMGRDTCVIAIGGGVVTDLAGFLSATYCRGIPLILIPTSLVSMIDASIGGKTGVNTIYGKNLIGALYEPFKIIIDPNLLTSLPVKEMTNGIVEMMKHGLIADQTYYHFLKQNLHFLIKQDQNVVKKAIIDSYRIKSAIVRQDKADRAIRHLLNFGHTIGHAIEKLADFSLSHGQAVAIGILIESDISVSLGVLSSSCFADIFSFINDLEISFEVLEHISVDDMLDCLALDKKSVHGRPRFVLLSEIGKCLTQDNEYALFVDRSVVKQSIERMKNDLCGH
jgi:3-dehydroquinate synthase